MTRQTEISPREKNIPAGWPRPFYRDSDGRRKYAQWSSASAYGQIMDCSSGRTYTAGTFHLCSSCGAQMSKGLVLDRNALKAHPSQERDTPERFQTAVSGKVNLDRLNKYDTHYGSPICYRCAVFASHHCPYFGGLHALVGDNFTWTVTTSSADYEEFDETTALHLTDDGVHLPRVTTGDVRKEVQAGNLHLTGVTADQVKMMKRPADYEFGEQRGPERP